MPRPKHKPKPRVKLLGKNGNAFAIMNRVEEALRKEGYTREEIAEYKRESMSGDYDHLLRVAMDWADVG
jgi:hypothetical protein